MNFPQIFLGGKPLEGCCATARAPGAAVAGAGLTPVAPGIGVPPGVVDIVGVLREKQ